MTVINSGYFCTTDKPHMNNHHFDTHDIQANQKGSLQDITSQQWFSQATDDRLMAKLLKC